MIVRTFESEKNFITDSVEFVTQICVKDECASLALSGGSTPKPFYEALGARRDIPFDRIRFFEVDERYVPKTHPDSNAHLIETALGRPIIAFDTTKPISEALEEYEHIIRPYQPFGLAILGMGRDGHIASLFPRSPTLHETKRLVAHTTTDRFAVRDRLTLTFPAILASKRLLLLLSGKEKQAALDTLLHSDVSFDDFPAKKLVGHPRLTIHFCV